MSPARRRRRRAEYRGECDQVLRRCGRGGSVLALVIRYEEERLQVTGGPGQPVNRGNLQPWKVRGRQAAGGESSARRKWSSHDGWCVRPGGASGAVIQDVECGAAGCHLAPPPLPGGWLGQGGSSGLKVYLWCMQPSLPVPAVSAPAAGHHGAGLGCWPPPAAKPLTSILFELGRARACTLLLGCGGRWTGSLSRLQPAQTRSWNLDWALQRILHLHVIVVEPEPTLTKNPNTDSAYLFRSLNTRPPAASKPSTEPTPNTPQNQIYNSWLKLWDCGTYFDSHFEGHKWAVYARVCACVGRVLATRSRQLQRVARSAAWSPPTTGHLLANPAILHFPSYCCKPQLTRKLDMDNPRKPKQSGKLHLAGPLTETFYCASGSSGEVARCPVAVATWPARQRSAASSCSRRGEWGPTDPSVRGSPHLIYTQPGSGATTRAPRMRAQLSTATNQVLTLALWTQSLRNGTGGNLKLPPSGEHLTPENSHFLAAPIQ